MPRMSPDEIIALIQSSKGRIFTCIFIKRTPPHDERTMVCRIEVSKYVTGRGRVYEFEDYALVPVFDMQKAQELSKEGKDLKKAYRVIPLEGIVELRVNHQHFDGM